MLGSTRLAARSPALAKLTRPRLYDALARPRLFALLDEAATRPIVWISAPPGSGKTTLVASYVEARDRPCLGITSTRPTAIRDVPPLHAHCRAAARRQARSVARPVFTPTPSKTWGASCVGSAGICSRRSQRERSSCSTISTRRATTAHTAAALRRGSRRSPTGPPVVVTSRRSARRSSRGSLRDVGLRASRSRPLRFEPEEAESMLAVNSLDGPVLDQVRRSERRLGGRAGAVPRAPEPSGGDASRNRWARAATRSSSISPVRSSTARSRRTSAS